VRLGIGIVWACRSMAALALATDRFGRLGRELLEFGIAIIEGPDGGCSRSRFRNLVLQICGRSLGSSRHRSWL
jgi:hypothetical protein